MTGLRPHGLLEQGGSNQFYIGGLACSNYDVIILMTSLLLHSLAKILGAHAPPAPLLLPPCFGM